MNLTLTRIMRPDATFGVLSTEDFPLCVTLELPWNDNKSDISCIPAGIYQYEQFLSPTKGNVWQIMNVPGRMDILIHEGNFLSNTEGCILVGSQFSGQGSTILNSDATLDFLRTILGTNGQLTIIEST